MLVCNIFSWNTLKEIAGPLCVGSLAAVMSGLRLSRDAARAVWGLCSLIFGALSITGGGLPKELPPPPEQQAPARQRRKAGGLKRPKVQDIHEKVIIKKVLIKIM